MKVEEVAIGYIGQTEKPGNAGFSHEDFETKMKEVGFQKGQAWCAYFAELCFKEAMPNNIEFDDLFSASAVQTFENFKSAGYVTDLNPQVGNLVIWQNQKDGKPQWSGHAGIVVRVISRDSFESVEGNTTTGTGVVREGFIVAKRVRIVRRVQTGLQVLGFVKIT